MNKKNYLCGVDFYWTELDLWKIRQQRPLERVEYGPHLAQIIEPSWQRACWALMGPNKWSEIWVGLGLFLLLFLLRCLCCCQPSPSSSLRKLTEESAVPASCPELRGACKSLYISAIHRWLRAFNARFLPFPCVVATLVSLSSRRLLHAAIIHSVSIWSCWNESWQIHRGEMTLVFRHFYGKAAYSGGLVKSVSSTTVDSLISRI